VRAPRIGISSEIGEGAGFRVRLALASQLSVAT
jgi:hypothetical protein